jgi:hypothetical protein
MITVAEPIDADNLRVRHEFLVAPGLRLFPEDVAQLFGLPVYHAKAILESLVFERFLARSSDGAYVRAWRS